MRRALNELAMEDGQTEDVGWTAAAEALLCAAVAGAPDIAARLASLPLAPSDGAVRRRAVLSRAVGSLVNAGHYALARDVVQRERLTGVADEAPATDGERDLLFSLAVLDVQTGPDGRPLSSPSAARQRFARVRLSAPPDTGLWWAALHGEMQAVDLTSSMDGVLEMTNSVLAVHPNLEFARWALPKLVNAGHYDLAGQLIQDSALEEPPGAQPLTDQDRDIVFSLAMLGLPKRTARVGNGRHYDSAGPICPCAQCNGGGIGAVVGGIPRRVASDRSNGRWTRGGHPHRWACFGPPFARVGLARDDTAGQWRTA